MASFLEGFEEIEETPSIQNGRQEEGEKEQLSIEKDASTTAAPLDAPPNAAPELESIAKPSENTTKQEKEQNGVPPISDSVEQKSEPSAINAASPIKQADADDEGDIVMTGYKAPEPETRPNGQRGHEVASANESSKMSCHYSKAPKAWLNGTASSSSASSAASTPLGFSSYAKNLQDPARTASPPVPFASTSNSRSNPSHYMPQPVPAARAAQAGGQNGWNGNGSFGRVPVISGSNARYPTSAAYASDNAFRKSTALANGSSAGQQPVRPVASSFTDYRSNGKAASGSGVIDLTEMDDGSSTDGRGSGRSRTSSGSGDIKVSGEKLAAAIASVQAGPAGARDAGGDDEIQVIGETASEANTPVCIGQLSGVALILYPIAELSPPARETYTNVSQIPPLPAAVLRAQPQLSHGCTNETIKLYSAHTFESFGVMEHRLANILGPLLTANNRRGQGVWVEAWVMRRLERNPMMLPMTMLVFCHPHFVQHASDTFAKNTAYLEQPQNYDPAMHGGFKLSNPHGERFSATEADRRRHQVLGGLTGSSTYSGSSGYQYGRFAAATKAPVEVQREQVEEMFKTMKSGLDIGEMEPDPMLTTKLYPHQKQALAFLVDRERFRTAELVRKPKPAHVEPDEGETAAAEEDEDVMISMWRTSRDSHGRLVGWVNTVTEARNPGPTPPPQCRGAILADDMGLGKTIVIIALIANTLADACAFSQQPATASRREGNTFDALAAHPVTKPGSSAMTMAGFSTPMYGVTNNAVMAMSREGSTPTSNGRGRKKKGESKKQKKQEEHDEDRLRKLKRRSKGTLIVCPLSTVVNWEGQIEEHVGLSVLQSSTSGRKKRGDKSGTVTPAASGLSVYVYHGNNRTNDLAKLASYDVVITTFSTLGSEFSKQSRKEEQDEASSSSSDGGIEETDATGLPLKGKKRKRRKIEGDATSPLQQIEWFRVVLDEAHMIKEHTTIQARAACELMAERRVCLTGTPLQNSLNDLFSLMRFLRLEPFTDREKWTSYIGALVKLNDPLGVSRLQLIMRHLALRRTKQTTTKEGKLILSIPPKKDEIRYITLDEQEKAFYASHHSKYKHNFEQLQKTDSVNKNYCSILQEVLRLRQICAHMALVRDGEDRAALARGEDPTDVVSAIRAHGLSKGRALRLLALMRDTGAAQCAECGEELASTGLSVSQDADEEEESKASKRSKKPRTAGRKGATVKSEDDPSNPSAPSPVLTRCQHLFCIACFRNNVSADFPENVSATDRAACSVCATEISPVIDAVQVSSAEIDMFGSGDGEEDTAGTTTKNGKKSHSKVVEHSSKIRNLVQDLFPLSQNNPASANYAGGEVDLSQFEEDAEFRPQPREAIKTVVFSQWTSLLDRIEDALDECSIKYERLDGGMNRADRTKALDTFKSDMSCEILLISLRAGGVGLNLTHASVVYLMEPAWNPAQESQAVDRLHRLGQTRPVKVIRLIAQQSVEANMLEIQKRKLALANLSLAQTLTKAQLAERRMEDLRTLFK